MVSTTPNNTPPEPPRLRLWDRCQSAAEDVITLEGDACDAVYVLIIASHPVTIDGVGRTSIDVTPQTPFEFHAEGDLPAMTIDETITATRTQSSDDRVTVSVHGRCLESPSCQTAQTPHADADASSPAEP